MIGAIDAFMKAILVLFSWGLAVRLSAAVIGLIFG
jgi:hypothetical protein